MSDETDKIKSEAFSLVSNILIDSRTPDPLRQIIKVMGEACAKCNAINFGKDSNNE